MTWTLLILWLFVVVINLIIIKRTNDAHLKSLSRPLSSRTSNTSNLRSVSR